MVVPMPRVFAGLPHDMATLPVVVDSTPVADPTAGFLQYGALGIFAMTALAALTWFVKQQAAELRIRTDKQEASHQARIAALDDALRIERACTAELRDEIRDLNRVQVDKVVPALLASAEMTKEAMHFIRDANRGQR